MCRCRPSLVVLGFLISLATPLLAQDASRQDDVTLAEARRLRAETERDPGLSDELRTQILELYDGAVASLEKAADDEATAEQFERDRRRVDFEVASLRAEIEQPESAPRLPLPDDATVSQAEDALSRERARMSANRAALRQQERIAEDRTKARNDTSQRLGELDLELELLNDELRRQSSSSARSEFKDAASFSILARRRSVVSEIALLRSHLALLNDRSKLVPLETDLVQRRVDASQELVDRLEEAAHNLRVEDARESLRQVGELGSEIAVRVPALADLTTETEALAQVLWKADGVVARSERTVKALDATRYHQAQLNRIAELTSRKFEAYGHRGSVTRWWPDIPDDFPTSEAMADTIQELSEEIPEVEHRLITYEQLRANAHNLNRATMLQLETELGDALDPALTARVRELLAVRQDILDELIQRMGRYSNQLVEYRTAANKFLTQVGEIERFLYSHILWSRSVPKPIIPRLGDMLDAAAALTPFQHLESLSLTNFKYRGQAIMAGLLLALILALRKPIHTRLHELAPSVGNPDRDSVGLTLGALLYTALLAAPLPTALYLVGTLAEKLGSSTYWHALSETCLELVMVTLLLETVRQIFAPDGLAEAHFKWPTYATQQLHRGLLLTETIGLPFLFVALHLAFAGMRLDSSDQLQLYNNSLGRMAFIAAMLIFGISILTMLRPEKKTEPAEHDMRVPWPQRFAEYAFPTAFLAAYPIIVLATFVPAVLAALGFYLTGVLLAYQMVRTLLLGLVVLVGGALVHRWRIVHRNRALSAQSGEIDEKTWNREHETAEKQVRQLFRFSVILAMAAGLLVIWSDALPMLQVMKRIQLLPRVQMLQPAEEASARLGAASTVGDAPQEPATDARSSSAESSVPAVPGAESTAPDQSTESQPLTLWNLLESILAGLITLVLVKNLPALIEMLLRSRTTLDGGARFAFSTLVRYSITIIGTIVVFGLLGVTWDKVQWLAAALTFGLGFGLQEIVANFVSGLILLVERPVRVGDVVTIGTLMGKVSRIQIRATTITLWDRSEMIVPNKEFITTKLVNWTLSDSKRRIEIPIRIAYGADLEMVKGLLVEAAEQHPAVLDDPVPHVLLLAFGDDAIQLELRFVVDFGQGLTTKDAVQMTIDRAFKEHGIEFALPKREIRLVSETRPENDTES